MQKLFIIALALAVLTGAGCEAITKLVSDNQDTINSAIDKAVDSGRLGSANADQIKDIINKEAQ